MHGHQVFCDELLERVYQLNEDVDEHQCQPPDEKHQQSTQEQYHEDSQWKHQMQLYSLL
jgi:hypothetical protein